MSLLVSTILDILAVVKLTVILISLFYLCLTDWTIHQLYRGLARLTSFLQSLVLIPNRPMLMGYKLHQSQVWMTFLAWVSTYIVLLETENVKTGVGLIKVFFLMIFVVCAALFVEKGNMLFSMWSWHLVLERSMVFEISWHR